MGLPKSSYNLLLRPQALNCEALWENASQGDIDDFVKGLSKATRLYLAVEGFRGLGFPSPKPALGLEAVHSYSFRISGRNQLPAFLEHVVSRSSVWGSWVPLDLGLEAHDFGI